MRITAKMLTNLEEKIGYNCEVIVYMSECNELVFTADFPTLQKTYHYAHAFKLKEMKQIYNSKAMLNFFAATAKRNFQTFTSAYPGK